MSDQFLGEIRLLPYTFAPREWSFARGQTIDVSQGSALFSVIGNKYGGEPGVTFCLPNFQVKAPLGSGGGAGLTPRSLGQEYGTASIVLDEDEIPEHRHGLQVSYKTQPERAAPGEDYLPHMMMDEENSAIPVYRKEPENYKQMASETFSTTGSSAAHDNCQPYLGLNFCIAIDGIYPIHD